MAPWNLEILLETEIKSWQEILKAINTTTSIPYFQARNTRVSHPVRNSRGTDSCSPRLKSWDFPGQPSLPRTRSSISWFAHVRVIRPPLEYEGSKSLQVSRPISSRVQETVGKNANNQNVFPQYSRKDFSLYRDGGWKLKKISRFYRLRYSSVLKGIEKTSQWCETFRQLEFICYRTKELNSRENVTSITRSRTS